MENRLQKLLQFEKDQPQDTFVKFALAKELENQGEWEKAIIKYNEVLQLDDQYIGVFYHLAKAYTEVENTEKAAQTYDIGMKLAKDLNDQHALAELSNAKTNFDLGL